MEGTLDCPSYSTLDSTLENTLEGMLDGSSSGTLEGALERPLEGMLDSSLYGTLVLEGTLDNTFEDIPKGTMDVMSKSQSFCSLPQMFVQ